MTTQRATGSVDAGVAGSRATPTVAPQAPAGFSGLEASRDFPLEQLTIAPDGLR